jgi:hypothetical protein
MASTPFLGFAEKAPSEGAHRAITVAQEQKARSFELRAAMSMARLWRDQDKYKEARHSRSGLRFVH